MWMFALDASPPDNCPTEVVTGEEVADFRAEQVAPVVLEVTERLQTLRDDAGSADCPTEEGESCTGPGGVEFEGRMVEWTEWDSDECWDDRTTSTSTSTVAAGLEIGGLEGASVSVYGVSTRWETEDWCSEQVNEGLAWDGDLAVAGTLDSLTDDTISGTASESDHWPTGSESYHQWTWHASSGSCAWEAESEAGDSYDGESLYRLEGWVEIVGVRVEYAVFTHEGDPYYSVTTVDGVATTDAFWATGDVVDSSAWLDADEDGWSDAVECDPADPEVGGVDCDGDGQDLWYDCDDWYAQVRSGATELCGDGVDQDCDGFDDGDCDGFDDEDCDDADPDAWPEAQELCGDGIDQDCDGFDDGDCDGFDDEDCDDADPAVYPEAEETCGPDANCDGVRDADCDGYDDRFDCDDTDPDTHRGAEDPICDGIDQDCRNDAEDCDGDGYLSTDCDNFDDSVHPSAIEVECDGVDQDCDGKEKCWAGRADCSGCGGEGAVVLLPLVFGFATRRRATTATPPQSRRARRGSRDERFRRRASPPELEP